MAKDSSIPHPHDTHPLARFSHAEVRDRLSRLLKSRRDAIAAEVTHNCVIPVDSEYSTDKRRQFAERAINAFCDLLDSGSLKTVDALAEEVAGPGGWAAADVQQVLSGVARAVCPILTFSTAEEHGVLSEAVTVLAACTEIVTVRAAREFERAVNLEMVAAEEKQRRFYQQVTQLATRNRLRLVADSLSMPKPCGEPISVNNAIDATRLRHAAQEAANRTQMDEERARDLALAVGEAAANVITHAGQGLAYVWTREETVFVSVQDYGGGIDILDLPRATLAPGWSSEPSLGMGFTLMLEMSDVLWLSTSPDGTTVCIEKSAVRRDEPVLNHLLETYAAT